MEMRLSPFLSPILHSTSKSTATLKNTVQISRKKLEKPSVVSPNTTTLRFNCFGKNQGITISDIAPDLLNN